MQSFTIPRKQKKAQEELRKSEARNRALLNAIPDMIFELDKNGVFINFFKPEEVDPELPPNQFVGKNIREVMPDFIASPTLFGIARTLLTDQTYAFEYQLPGKDGLHDYESRLIASGEDQRARHGAGYYRAQMGRDRNAKV